MFEPELSHIQDAQLLKSLLEDSVQKRIHSSRIGWLLVKDSLVCSSKIRPRAVMATRGTFLRAANELPGEFSGHYGTYVLRLWRNSLKST